MKKIKLNYLLVAALVLTFAISGCNKERAIEPDASFTVENIDSLVPGTAVIVAFEGEGEFVSIYSGKKGQIWGDTVPATGSSVMNDGKFSLLYSGEGEYVVTVVATSFGNWSEEELMDVKQQTIAVVDNRTAFSKFGMKVPKMDGIAIGSDIVFTMSDANDVTALKATWILASNLASVTVDGVVQKSGSTENDFTNPVLYTVLAGDGTSKTYTVTVNTIPASTETGLKELGIVGDIPVTALIDEGTKEMKLYAKVGTDTSDIKVYAIPDDEAATVTALVGGAEKEIKAAGTNMGLGALPTVFTVTAENGDTETWDLYTRFEKAFTEFKFGGLVPEIIGDLDSIPGGVLLTVLEGTDLTNLVVDFTLSEAGGSVEVGSTVQTSGATANDFTSPVTYELILDDGAIFEYDVIVNTISK
jgi:hypothetical protein